MKNNFWIFLLWTTLTLSIVAVVARSQEKPKFDLSETQTLRLRVKALEFATAQEHYQNSVASFNAEIMAVEKEHGWAETDVQFHPDTLTFTAIAKIPERPKPSMDKPNGPPPEPATGQTPIPAK